MEEIIPRLKYPIADLLKTRKPILIAIDGNCTAGKTSLAAALGKEYTCNIFHMDDFFLRPEQRTDERYAQPGGNVDYERFREEILYPLKSGGAFSYRPFSCKTFSLGEPVTVAPKELNIVEGTYSMHPFFEDPYDLKIFLSVDPQIQKMRILNRSPGIADLFFERWIPMENRYFDFYQIEKTAHIQLDTGHRKCVNL